MLKRLITIMFILLLVPLAHADLMSTYTSRPTFAGTDVVDWGQLGPSFTNVGNPVHATSTGGIALTVSQPSGAPWQRRDQGNGWAGNFAPGDHLLWDIGSSAPWTIVFGQQIDGLGFQIQSDFSGPFTAVLNVFDASSNLLGSFGESGTSNGNANNSAIFIGLKDLSGANIKFAQISLASGTNPLDFAINRMDLDPGTPSVPEPASIILLATVVVGVGWSRVKAGKRAITN